LTIVMNRSINGAAANSNAAAIAAHATVSHQAVV
jgi:hypothetical protein